MTSINIWYTLVNMKTPTLYTLTGLPYAGKSTLRNELVRRFGWVVISIDDINTERGVGLDERRPITQDDWNTTYTVAYDRLKKYLAEGKNVIFDGGSLLFEERETQRNIAESIGAQTKLIYVNTSLDEIKARWLENQQTRVRGHVPKSLFADALNMWEEPSSNEHPLIYNQTMDVNEWIQQHIEGQKKSPETRS